MLFTQLLRGSRALHARTDGAAAYMMRHALLVCINYT
jgi:hypothetical protein